MGLRSLAPESMSPENPENPGFLLWTPKTLGGSSLSGGGRNKRRGRVDILTGTAWKDNRLREDRGLSEAKMMDSSASRPLLRRGGKSGARLGGGGGVVKLLAATAAVLAGCGVALVAVGGGRASDLVQIARPGGKLVRYMYVPEAVAEGELPDGAPVPGLKVVKAYAGQRGVQRMIPINQLKMDPAQPAYLSVSVPLTTLAGNDTNATDGGGGNETEASGNATEAGNELMKSRSCAISSLVDQAKAIFPEWNKCGYMSEWSSVANGSETPTGVVSGPSDDAACG